jgi:hypothetical protein
MTLDAAEAFALGEEHDGDVADSDDCEEVNAE